VAFEKSFPSTQNSRIQYSAGGQKEPIETNSVDDPRVG